MVVMAAALEALGDSYGIYGFSGYSKDNVELFVAKEPDDAFSQSTLKNIAAMSPKGSTRMGPAIRHASQKLMNTGSAMKVLMVISDGFPQDCDYGPVRGITTTAWKTLPARYKSLSKRVSRPFA
jgi:nitric oxide reductase NorD protein